MYLLFKLSHEQGGRKDTQNLPGQKLIYQICPIQTDSTFLPPGPLQPSVGATWPAREEWFCLPTGPSGTARGRTAAGRYTSAKTNECCWMSSCEEKHQHTQIHENFSSGPRLGRMLLLQRLSGGPEGPDHIEPLKWKHDGVGAHRLKDLNTYANSGHTRSFSWLSSHLMMIFNHLVADKQPTWLLVTTLGELPCYWLLILSTDNDLRSALWINLTWLFRTKIIFSMKDSTGTVTSFNLKRDGSGNSEDSFYIGYKAPRARVNRVTDVLNTSCKTFRF